jgi:hypothetical protein
MKKFMSILVLGLFVTDAYADDWRMRKFDTNKDGFVVKAELKGAGCTVKTGLFNQADKNNDSKLSKNELRKASVYIIRNRCPRG